MFRTPVRAVALSAALSLILASAPAIATAGESVKGGQRLPMTAKDLKNPKPPFGGAAQEKPAEVKAGQPAPPPMRDSTRDSTPKR